MSRRSEVVNTSTRAWYEGKCRNGFFSGSNGFFLGFFEIYEVSVPAGARNFFRPKTWMQEAILTRFRRNRGFSSHAKIPSDGGDFAPSGDLRASRRLQPHPARRRHARRLWLGTQVDEVRLRGSYIIYDPLSAFGVLPRHIASCCARRLGAQVELQRACL